MDIANVIQTQSTLGSASGAQQDIGAEFDTFLTLLTAQIRNQDPLAPLDSTQFVEQLATFTSLEQQVRGNQYLESIALTMSELVSVAANEWIGQTVEVESAYVPFEGEAVSFNANLPPQAEQAILRVVNSDGTVIKTQNLGLTDSPWEWTGTMTDGDITGNGIYQLRIELFQGGNFIGSVAPRLISEVTEAGVENGKIRLGFNNHLTEFADNVRKMK